MKGNECMYYPKQIPYLLDEEFKKNIEYREYNIVELESYCMCIWTMKSRTMLDKIISNNILPDACVDIVIDFSNKSICFSGFSKDTKDFKLSEKIDYMGVRLKPGIFYFLFNISADEVMDNAIPFGDIEKEFDISSIFNLESTEEKIEYLKKYLLDKVKGKDNYLFVNVVDNLYKNPSEQSVTDIARKFGYNERHLYRVFKTNCGISPKVLLNILRLHLCLTLMLEEKMKLIDVANICGFYDQSHFIKEIKKYTGISPLKIIDDYK